MFATPMEPRCPICSSPLAALAVIPCDACGTQHHRQCWDYAGGCAVYGCRRAPARPACLPDKSKPVPPGRAPRLDRRLLAAAVLLIALFAGRAAPRRDRVDRLPTRPSTGARPARSGFESPAIRSLAFSPDGGLVAASGYCDTVRIHDARTGALVRTIRSASTPGRMGISALAWSPRGLLAGGVHGHGITLWNPATGGAGASLRSPGDGEHMIGLEFAPDGVRLHAARADRLIQQWDVPAGRVTTSVATGSYGYSDVALSGGGELVAFEAGNEIRVCDARDLTLRQQIEVHVDHDACRSLSPDGRWLAIGGYDPDPARAGSRIAVVDVRTRACLRRMSFPRNIAEVAFSPAGDRLVGMNWTQTVCFDPRSGRTLWAFEKTRGTQSSTIAVSAAHVAVGTFEGAIHLLDAATGRETAAIPRPRP